MFSIPVWNPKAESNNTHCQGNNYQRSRQLLGVKPTVILSHDSMTPTAASPCTQCCGFNIGPSNRASATYSPTKWNTRALTTWSVEKVADPGLYAIHCRHISLVFYSSAPIDQDNKPRRLYRHYLVPMPSAFVVSWCDCLMAAVWANKSSWIDIRAL